MKKQFDPFDEEPANIPEEIPIFPLPEMVLLPGEPMPLHIFEERYKIMTESAIETERLIVLGHLKPGWETRGEEKSEIYDVAGLGQIVMDERLKDGQFNLVLLGLKRIRIKQMIQMKPYFRGQIELLTDRYSETSPTLLSSIEAQLMELSKKYFQLKKRDTSAASEESIQMLENVKPGIAPLGTLCDLVAASLSLPPVEKQMILEEMDVIRRAEKVIFSLRFQLEAMRLGPASSQVIH